MKELEKNYNPAEIESRLYENGKIKSISMQRWTEAKSLSQ